MCGVPKDDSEFYVYNDTGRLWGKCKACHIAYCVARASANPEEHNARSRAWREAHPGRASSISRAWQLRHPEKFRQSVRRGKYNIDFESLWVAQSGLCACCHQPMLREGKDWNSVCVDHDRSCCSGKKSCGKCVRGLIHWGCNMLLGYAKDSPDLLRFAANYLDRKNIRPKQD